MLEKDKNCIEFSMRSMMVTHRPYQEDMEIAITGMAPEKSLLLANNPFNIPCDVVVVSKSYFERMQADDQHYRELAKQREHNYELLLTMTGFNTLEELTDYIHDAGKNSKGCWKTLKEIADDAEKDYIFERDKAEALEKENEELKKKLQVPDPFAEYKEMLKKLNSAEDAENLEWVLNHTCGGQASVNGWMVTAKLWRQNYETLSKLVGFSSVEEIKDYLTNEAECDTLNEAISKLHDQVKYTWEEITGFSTPEKCSSYIDTLEKKLEDIKDLIEED